MRGPIRTGGILRVEGQRVEHVCILLVILPLSTSVYMEFGFDFELCGYLMLNVFCGNVRSPFALH